MADIQHSLITDPNVHEPKGISAAGNKQSYVSDGAGSGAWTDVDYNVCITQVLEARSTDDQEPSGTDTDLQVNFGAEQTNQYVSLSSGGTITINEAGCYFLTVNLRLGRTTAASEALIGIRYSINGVVAGRPTAIKLDDGAFTIPYSITLLNSFSEEDEITIEIVRDSSSADNGGLFAASFDAPGWDDAPSATIFMQKLNARL
ncbi:MAG: hypothetical protein OQK25_07850 [Gammaproteobacteria bacterium]|nr:hypothetical protein [Gammaproteobacteria bacterium]MCW8982494.1 hypothetical protein [Gammaproteobacteria bacterium]